MGRTATRVRAAATVLGLTGIAAAAGARQPVLRRWPLSVLQAVPCLPASEAPRALSALHAVVGAVSLLSGGFTGALANGAAVAALAGLRGDAARSAAVLEAALAPLGAGRPGGEPPTVLGADAGRATGGVPTSPSTRGADPDACSGVRAEGEPPGGRLLAGRAARRRHLRAADIAYGPGPAQRLDVWARPDLDPDGRAPVLVQVHGGGWTGGDKAFAGAPLNAYLAERGWVVVSVNYRLGPAERWPAMIVDVKAAIAWVRRSVADFGGDPRFVAISGGSAGGHLAALAALSPNDPAFQPGFADVDTTLAAAVPLYGVHDFSVDEHGLFELLEGKVIGTTHIDDADTWQQASPLHRAGPHAPPFLVVHGDTDTIVGVGQSRRFVQRLREVSGAPVLYAELPHAQHGFDGLPTRRTAHTVRAVHRFLSTVHREHRAAQRVGQLAEP